MRTLGLSLHSSIKSINSNKINTRISSSLNEFCLYNKFIIKNFSKSSLNQNIKENVIVSNSNKTSKKLIFYYKKIEYQSTLSENADMSLKDFLTIFANQQNIIQKNSPQKSYKDFQMFKNGRYAPNDFYITRLETSREDPNPLTLVDFDINYKNFRYRNIDDFKIPIDSHSNRLQVYLNSFLKNIEINSFDNTHVFSMIQNNPNYYLKTEIGLYQLAASLIGVDNHNGIFKFGVDLDMSNIERSEVKGLHLLKSKVNDLVIPITIVKGSENIISNKKLSYSNKKENQNVSEWNNSIVDNLDKIRKVSLKYNLHSNFGIVTDFETWKINYYAKPEDTFIETNENYQSSLKYDILLNNLTSSNDLYRNFIKIIKGITNMNKKEARSLNINIKENL